MYISYNDKKSKRKRKKSRGSGPEALLGDQEKNADKKFSKMSFHKMAQMVKIGRTITVGSKDSPSKVDVVDGDEEEGEDSKEEDEGPKQSRKSPPSRPPPPSPSTLSPTSPRSVKPSSESEQPKPRKKRPPPRLGAIKLKHDSQKKLDQPAVTSTSLADTSSDTVDSLEGGGKGGETATSSPRPSRAKTKRVVPQPHSSTAPHNSVHSPHRLSTRSQFSSAYSEGEDDFFVVNYIHMCLCGLWLCVANRGGSVMAFDFTTTAKERSAGVRLVHVDQW